MRMNNDGIERPFQRAKVEKVDKPHNDHGPDIEKGQDMTKPQESDENSDSSDSHLTTDDDEPPSKPDHTQPAKTGELHIADDGDGSKAERARSDSGDSGDSGDSDDSDEVTRKDEAEANNISQSKQTPGPVKKQPDETADQDPSLTESNTDKQAETEVKQDVAADAPG